VLGFGYNTADLLILECSPTGCCRSYLVMAPIYHWIGLYFSWEVTRPLRDLLNRDELAGWTESTSMLVAGGWSRFDLSKAEWLLEITALLTPPQKFLFNNQLVCWMDMNGCGLVVEMKYCYLIPTKTEISRVYIRKGTGQNSVSREPPYKFDPPGESLSSVLLVCI